MRRRGGAHSSLARGNDQGADPFPNSGEDNIINGLTILFFKRRAQDRFQDWLRDYPRATPIAVFCIALGLVAVAARSVEVAERRTWLAEQQAVADDIASKLERKAASDSAYVLTMASLFANVGSPSPETFSAYITRLRVLENLSGVVGVGWVDEVHEGEIETLKRRLSVGGAQAFNPYPVSQAKNWPIYLTSMIEPRTTDNLALIGFDMGSEARRAAAMQKAKRIGIVTASDKVQLMQDAKRAQAPGFLVFAPVRSTLPGQRFLGFVYLPIRTQEFVNSAVDSRLLASGRVELVDGTPSGEETIFSSIPEGHFGAVLEEKLEIFDQKWTLRYAPPAEDGFYPLSLVVLFGGSAFSTLLLAYVLLVQRRNGDLHALLDAQLVQEKERAAFIRELNHRVKNTLANVTSMIALSRYRTDNVQIFADTLLQRVKALAASHSLLDGQKWGPTELRAIITTQLSAHDGSGERIDIEGPEVMISANDALTIGLAVHELATNATRYGALSNDEGRVKVHWQAIDDQWVEVEWQEEGGPPVAEPDRLGLGLNLVQRALAHELRRPIDIQFNPEGLRCHFYVQLRTPKSFQLRK